VAFFILDDELSQCPTYMSRELDLKALADLLHCDLQHVGESDNLR